MNGAHDDDHHDHDHDDDHERGRGKHGGHGHSHSHGLTATGTHRKSLILVLAITSTVFVAEVIGGLLSGSLALLADAGHMLTDATGLVLALIGASFATTAATTRRTYGLQRAEVLAALANALLLVGISVWVLIQAVDRLRNPTEIETGLMLVVAIVGALANTAGLLILRRGQSESLNIRGAYLEVLGDLVGSVAVIIAAILIMMTGWTRFDAIASLAIFVLILPRAWALLREVVDVLLEATPRGVDLDDVRQHMEELPSVVAVHDLHAWTITSGMPVLSAHVIVDDACITEGRSGEVLDQLGECLGGHFDVKHCTFQIEPVGHLEHETSHHP
ncbi:MAG TPA: cation diffusion facilitator family transporter [Propionibacteriaceae bacterium]|nr:cation diffusion facilitator family transporter [Propionibacteriaceae bacterium]